MAAPAPSAQAESTATPAHGGANAGRVARLNKALAALATDSGGSEAMVVLSLLAGVGYTVIGVAMATDPDQEPRDSEFRALAVTESLILGGLCFGYGAYGIASWGSPPAGTHRYARFQRDVRAGRLNLFKLGQYEGELYLDAMAARNGRRSAGFVSLAVAASGAGLIALAATSDMRGDARGLTYAEGGGFLALGTLGGILSLAGESAYEREWRRYRSGSTTAATARWSVLPKIAPGGFVLAAGVSL